MKNQIIFTALTLGAVILGTNAVKAQDVSTPADQVATTVASIELADVISINTGATTAGGAVNFKYATVDAYTKDQTIEKVGSLNITSTQKFTVNVKATTENFAGPSDNIKLAVLQIIPVKNTSTMKGTFSEGITLSMIDQPLVKDAPLGSELTLDINYHIPAAMSKSSEILGKPSGTYKTSVMYTATAK